MLISSATMLRNSSIELGSAPPLSNELTASLIQSGHPDGFVGANFRANVVNCQPTVSVAWVRGGGGTYGDE